MFRNADDVTLTTTSHFSPQSDGPSTDPTQLAEYQGPFPTSAERLPSLSSCFRCLAFHGCCFRAACFAPADIASQSWACLLQLRREVPPKHSPGPLAHSLTDAAVRWLRSILVQARQGWISGAAWRAGPAVAAAATRPREHRGAVGRPHARSNKYESSRCLALPCVPQRIGSWKEYYVCAKTSRDIAQPKAHLGRGMAGAGDSSLSPASSCSTTVPSSPSLIPCSSGGGGSRGASLSCAQQTPLIVSLSSYFVEQDFS